MHPLKSYNFLLHDILELIITEITHNLIYNINFSLYLTLNLPNYSGFDFFKNVTFLYVSEKNLKIMGKKMLIWNLADLTYKKKNPFSNTWLSMKLFLILLNQKQYNLILILSFEVKHRFRLAQNKWWGISGEIKTPLQYMTSSLLHNLQLSYSKDV